MQLLGDDEYHISLSRTFPMRHHYIKPFIALLEKNLLGLPGFMIDLSEYQYFTNDDKTRSFMSMRVANAKDHVCSIISRIDNVLADFGFPVYYKNPFPHLTIGWGLGDSISNLSIKEGTILSNFTMYVSKIECKIGKWKYEFNLA